LIIANLLAGQAYAEHVGAQLAFAE
jgi:hypothetical protein